MVTVHFRVGYKKAYQADFNHSWLESSPLINQPAQGWAEMHGRVSAQLSLLDTLKGGCATATTALGQVVVLRVSRADLMVVSYLLFSLTGHPV